MSIRTEEDLIDKIAEERIWRVKEISQMKNLITTPSITSEKKSVLYRSFLALLYAHWEGFVKKTGTYYLEFISNQRIPLKELQNNFVTLCLKGKIDIATKSKKYSTFDHLTDILIDKADNALNLPYKKVVNTESNLSSSVLKEICWCLGVDYTFFESKEKFIDSHLLARRNHIAHGEELKVDENDIIEIIDEVLILLDILRSEIENSIHLKRYRKA